MRCIQTVEPYAVSGAVRGAARALEQVTKKLNEQTTMYKLCAACNKQYGKASQAAIDACTKVLITLRIALKYKDIEKEYHITEEFLTGKSMKVSGFVQTLFKKNGFVEFFKEIFNHSNKPWANEVRDNVFPKLLRIEDLEATFVNSGAAIGATAPAEDTAPATAPEELINASSAS